MFVIAIIILGAAAAWLLSEKLLEPVSRWGQTADENSSPVLVRVGRLFFKRFNQRPGLSYYLRTLDGRLRLAGRRNRGEWSLAEAEGSGVVAGVSTIVLLALATGTIGIGTLIAGVFVAFFAGWLMLARVSNWITERRKQLNRQFPYFLDLAVMSMDSGTGMLEVVDAYARSAPGTALTQELTALTSDIRMGSTVESALTALEGRIPSDDLMSVSRSIRQGLRMGTPLSQVFREQADSMRFKRSQSAERSAEELKVKLQGPAMLLVIAVLVLVLGPAIVGMASGGF